MPQGVGIQDIRQNVGEVAAMYRWNLRFDGQPSSVANWPDLTNTNLYCTSAAPPQMEAGEQATINIRTHSILRPGMRKPNHTITLNFIDDEENTISQWLTNWREAVFDPETGQQTLTYEEINATVCVLTRLNKRDSGIWEYKMFGCYHNGGDPTGGELGSDEEIVRPTMEMYYDYFREGPPGSS